MSYPFSKSDNSQLLWELDFGDKQRSTTTSASGIRASGNPNRLGKSFHQHHLGEAGRLEGGRSCCALWSVCHALGSARDTPTHDDAPTYIQYARLVVATLGTLRIPCPPEATRLPAEGLF